jgi:hypothetical protein
MASLLLTKLSSKSVSSCSNLRRRIGKEITERNGASPRFLSGRKTGG